MNIDLKQAALIRTIAIKTNAMATHCDWVRLEALNGNLTKENLADSIGVMEAFLNSIKQAQKEMID